MAHVEECGLWLIASLRSGVGPEGSAGAVPRSDRRTAPLPDPLRELVRVLAEALRAWRRHSVERRELAALLDYELRDIGRDWHEIAHVSRTLSRKEHEGRCRPRTADLY